MSGPPQGSRIDRHHHSPVPADLGRARSRRGRSACSIRSTSPAPASSCNRGDASHDHPSFNRNARRQASSTTPQGADGPRLMGTSGLTGRSCGPHLLHLGPADRRRPPSLRSLSVGAQSAADLAPSPRRHGTGTVVRAACLDRWRDPRRPLARNRSRRAHGQWRGQGRAASNPDPVPVLDDAVHGLQGDRAAGRSAASTSLTHHRATSQRRNFRPSQNGRTRELLKIEIVR